MVKLAEWMGKGIFRKHGIPTPVGVVVRSAEEAEAATRTGRVPLPCVVKAQVLAGGRGKGGAVQFANTPAEAALATRSILALEFKGEKVREVLLEQKVSILREFYLSFALDRSLRMPILMASAQGGVEVESVPEEAILRIPIHPFVGLAGYERRQVIRLFGLSGPAAKSLDDLLDRAWGVFQSEDAELVEINPLGLVGSGVIALDAKVVIEDDAAFRHPEYSEVRDDRTPLEEIAREKGIAFVQLDGNIGVIANGAGLTMATLDVLAEFGGRPGVFLDLGGTDDPGKVTEAFLLMAKAMPRAVFLNIFGGVTRCDTVATGLVEAMKQVPASERFPLVARIRGNNEAEGVAILKSAGVTSLSDLKESVQATVRAAEVPVEAPRGTVA
ncbi:MAG: ADP-forming succinate--CoA ligase subunit beta [Thermoplasmata archaeon]|nr:ADP-forming succinate--CoA ligase subunit beta [Thermoplasmata archaeon]MCI4359017.1 ADP-forming succinate--CoA ligase subunit beta [Thermoplasmata archaeon]